MQRAPTFSSARRRGFSFTEVLFAVMILGVGFIMVAAIFPVAIQQSRTTAEETAAAAVTRGGVNYVEKLATNAIMPATNNVVVSAYFDGATAAQRDTFTLAWALNGSAVVAADGRYAWVPFYRRAGDPADPSTWSAFAQVIMIPVHMRNEGTYETLTDVGGKDVPRGGPQVRQNRTGIPGTARIIGSINDGQDGGPDWIEFKTDFDIPSPGAFVIVADAAASLGADVAPHVNGRVYRLGNQIDANKWELMPGFDFEPIRVDANNVAGDGAAPNPLDGKEVVVGGADGRAFEDALLFVVGRGLTSTGGAGAIREGPAQDIAAYATFVTVR